MTPILRDLPEQFETERLILRAPRAGDGQIMFEAIVESLDALKPWMDWAHQIITPEAEEQVARRGYAHFLERTDLPLLLFHKQTGDFVGGSGLHRFDWNVPRFEIGYWVRTCYQGHGYITESTWGVTRFAFETLGAERVEIRMDDRNERSWRVAERLHFTFEGVLRHDARGVSGELRNTRVYSLLRSEWSQRAAQIPNEQMSGQ